MTKKYSLKIAFIYTATILGAGFATGKELVSFFAFYKLGILGFFLACFFIGLIGFSILNCIYNSKQTTYDGFMQEMFLGLGKYLAIFNLSFVFVIFCSMIAGGGEALSSLLNIDKKLCVFIFCLITFLILTFDENFVLNINAMLCPFLILGCAIIGIYLTFFSQPVFNNHIKAISSPFIYASYNTITTISVLFTLKNMLINKRVVLYSGVLSGFFIFIIGVFMLIPLMQNFNIIKNVPLPIISLMQNNIIFSIIYNIIILIAIFTTAISNGFALCKNINIKINKTLFKLILVILGFMFSFCGFSKIVDFVYPFFGLIGIFEIAVILLSMLEKQN